jgi:chemotaxis protein MotB
MSGQQEDVASHPLVIVRRRRNADEPHHGGVWKIAYADFMTAMMAFFLVMWLINAADKKTIVQVAAYFNPMRLTDRFDAPKGLEDMTEAQSKPTDKGSKKGFEKIDEKQKLEAEQASKENIGEAMDEAAKKTSAAAGGKSAEAQKEQALFDNPGEMLEKLADEAKASQPTTASSPSDGSLDDPFDRLNRRSGKAQPIQKLSPQAAPPVSSKIQEPKQPPPMEGKAQEPNRKPPPAQGKAQEPSKQPPPAQGKAEKLSKQPPPAPAKEQDLAKQATPATASKEDEKPSQKEAEAKKIEADISNAVSAVSKELPHLEVKATPEGLLISLMDDANFGMFEVGSAKPRPELVLAMSKIGEVLKDKKGKIVVRGHTDSRAYKGGVYDNWRLSAARAQMAYYMLVRGGVAESSVVAIEGRADRDPKLPNDTTAAQNRRIDILIKGDRP